MNSNKITIRNGETTLRACHRATMRTFLVASAIAAAVSGGVGVVAAAEGESIVEEIIVTARKREESIQDIPVAISVMTAQAMEQNNLRSVAEIAAYVPGLTINSDSTLRAFVSIRGIGASYTTSVQPGVGLFVDGVYTPTTAYFNNPVLDIDRIEVLRGPQGTLYGRNTLGGAINVVSRAPSDELGGRVFAQYTDEDNGYLYGGAVGGAIVPGKLQARIAAASERSDGFYENKLLGTDAFPREADSVNGSLRWLLSDQTSLTVNLAYMDLLGGNGSYAQVRDIHDFDANILLNSPNTARIEYHRANARLDTAIESLHTDVTAIVAYDGRDESSVLDNDLTPFHFEYLEQGVEEETWSAELRFDTQFSDSFSTLLAAFASRSDGDITSDAYTSFDPFALPADLLYRSGMAEREQDSHAFFGTLFWRLQPDLEFTAGLRYDHESLESRSTSIDQLTGVVTVRPPRQFRDDVIDPKFSLTKFWSERTMTYVSAARGHRGGGLNSPLAPAGMESYAGDSLWAYEVGSKFELPGGAGSFAMSAFYNDFRNYIELGPFVQNPQTGGLSAEVINFGDIKSYGVDVELAAAITSRWKVGGSATYTHARIGDSTPYEQATGMVLASDLLNFQPDWKLNVDSSYALPVGVGTLTLRGAVAVTGPREGGTGFADRIPDLDEYVLVNGSIAYEVNGLELSVFANNLFDEQYFEVYSDRTAIDPSGLFFPYNLAILGAQRRVGVRAQYSF